MEAVLDLAVNSDATDNYLNNIEKLKYTENIPVHTVAPRVNNDDGGFLCDGLWTLLGWYGYGPAETEFGEANDLVVAVGSQVGGVASHTFLLSGPDHLQSPDNNGVREHIKQMLAASVQDSRFTNAGFKPVDRIWEPRFNINQTRRIGFVSNDAPKDIHLNVDNSGENVFVNIEDGDLFDFSLIEIDFGQEFYYSSPTSVFDCAVPATFSGNYTVYAYCANAGGDILRKTFIGHID